MKTYEYLLIDFNCFLKIHLPISYFKCLFSNYIIMCYYKSDLYLKHLEALDYAQRTMINIKIVILNNKQIFTNLKI